MKVLDSLMNTRLTKAKDSQEDFAIFLVNGVKLKGHVVAFDADSIQLTSNNVEGGITVQRAAIATIQRDVPTHNNANNGGNRR